MQLQVFLRAFTIAAIALGVLLSGISWALGASGIALGIALTTPVSLFWIRSTATTVHAMVSDPSLRLEGATPQSGEAWKLLAKLPLVGLALTCILWYMPARPEGVAIGVLNGLLAAVYAAIRHNKTPSSTTPAHSPPPQV